MEPSKPLVSIIIPAYNAERYIDEAVTSALRQEYPNKEIIVIDDGSEDETPRRILAYREKGSVRYIRQENKGLSAARNLGIRTAQGKYIALLDSDDAFLPDKINFQVEALENNPGYNVCYCDLLHFKDAMPRKFYHHTYHSLYRSANPLRELIRKQFINPLSIIAKKEVFEKYGYFDETLRRSEDWDLWLRWSRAGVQFYYVDEVLAHYRVRDDENNTSVNNEPLMKEENLILFAKFFNGLTAEEKKELQEKTAFCNLEKRAAAAYLLVRDKKNALVHLNRAAEYQKDGVAPLKLAVALLPASLLQYVARLIRKIKRRNMLTPVTWSVR